MTSTTDPRDVIARLGAANPAKLDPRRGHSPAARAVLERILADSLPDDASPSPLARLHGRLRTRSARGLAAVGATLIVGGGGALAAADPMGWWSAAPDRASYASNSSVHVATPTALMIRCQIGVGGKSVCTPTNSLRRGLTYVRIGAIPRPNTISATRRSLLGRVSAARTQRRISATDAARLRADIAAVPDSFLTAMALTERYGGFGIESRTATGKTLVPPAGIPAFLACQDASPGRLTCRNLNGATNAPVGAGVYAVNHTRWRTVAVTRPASEHRLLDDMQRFGTILRAGTRRRGSPTS